MIEQMGLEGYGIFWVLVETLREQPNFMYPLELVPALARRYNTTTAKMRTVIDKYDLFTVTDDRNFFFSYSLTRRMTEVNAKRDKMRVNALKRWHGDDAEAMQLHFNGNPNAMQVKESKVKERITPTPSSENEAAETEANFPEPTPLQQVAQHYESTAGLLSGTAMHDLQGFLSAGMDAETICDCIDTVKARNPTPRWSQINRELEQWRINGWLHRIPHDKPAYRLAAEDMTEFLVVRKSEPELQEWARTFEAMIQGGTPPADIWETAKWAITGDNWWARQKNITSAESLRRNYEKIRVQMAAQSSTA